MRDWVPTRWPSEYALSLRLGQPLAHGRHGRRGHGRGHLDPAPEAGIARFVAERKQRLARLREMLSGAGAAATA